MGWSQMLKKKKKIEIPGSFTQPNLISVAPRNAAWCGEPVPPKFTGMAVEILENQSFPRQPKILKMCPCVCCSCLDRQEPGCDY